MTIIFGHGMIAINYLDKYLTGFSVHYKQDGWDIRYVVVHVSFAFPYVFILGIKIGYIKLLHL